MSPKIYYIKIVVQTFAKKVEPTLTRSRPTHKKNSDTELIVASSPYTSGCWTNAALLATRWRQVQFGFLSTTEMTTTKCRPAANKA